MDLTWWDAPLITLWALWATQSVLCMLQVRKFSRRLRRGDREGFERFRPPAVVVVPFKGLDHEATANLHGLFKQHYPRYRLLLVVEDEADPAHAFLQDELRKLNGVPAELIVAGVAPDDTGQKVHNLAAALQHLQQTRTGEPHADEAWVFADSDAVPHARWLGDLVGPLAQKEKTAITTGYRWMVPARGPQGRFKVGGRFASVINSAVACFASNDRFALAWGGSMAMLADTAQRGDLLGHWRGALSDDFQVTRMAHQLGGRIYFLPECIVESPVDMTFGDLAEFARRQYLITRVHDAWLYLRGLAVVWMYVIATLTAWVGVPVFLLTQRHDMATLAAIAIVVVAVFNQLRALFRRRAVRELFGSGTYGRLRPALRLDQWGTAAVMAVNAWLLLTAVVGRTITWRGKRYRLKGPNNIQRIA